jgi:hypothetical protein
LAAMMASRSEQSLSQAPSALSVNLVTVRLAEGAATAGLDSRDQSRARVSPRPRAKTASIS